MLIGLVKSFCK